MKRRQKNNFVDDVKVAQRIRHSRTSQVDLLNGEGIGEDLGLVQGTLNAIGNIHVYETMTPEPLEPGGSGTTTQTPTIPTQSEPTNPTSQSVIPFVYAGTDKQITLPASSVQLDGSSGGFGVKNKSWSYVTGPSGAAPQFSNPASEQTDVSNLTIPGDYTFRLTIYYGTNDTQKSDDVIVTVYPQLISEPPIPLAPSQPETPSQPASSMPPPADNNTINNWDCSQLNTYLNVYNQVLSDPTLDQQTRISYENALLYINNRINTVCNPSTTPHIDVPTEPTSEIVAPLPTIADIDAMNCDQLNSLKTALVINESAYRTDSTTLQNYINTVNYVDLQFTQKCKNTTPTAPTVEIYAPGTTPYATGVKSSGLAGGGGSGSSSGTPKPEQQNYKHWWWLGVIVVVGALILFKPGTKIGVPSK